MMQELQQFAAAVVGPYGAFFLLIAIIGSGARGWWVWGSTHRALELHYQAMLDRSEDEKRQWRTLALSGTSLANRLVTVAEKTSPLLSPPTQQG
jgi:hypothetical protein